MRELTTAILPITELLLTCVLFILRSWGQIYPPL